MLLANIFATRAEYHHRCCGSTNTPITKDIKGCKLDYEKCDGIYGESTKEMVKQLQKDYGLDVDGIVGNQTYEALGGALSFAKVK